MKKLYTLLLAISLSTWAFAQNVTILPSGITPATGGIPKMTYEDILAIPSPEVGDLVIDISNNTLRMWNGTEWSYFTSGLSKDNVLLTGYSIQGDSLEYVTSIDFDPSGNRYITGIFNGSASFGNTTLINPPGRLYTAFVAKQNAAGDFIWIKTSLGNGTLVPLKLRLDNAGNIFLSGYASGSFTLWDGGGSFSTQSSDAVTIKLNNSGVPQWCRVMGGPGDERISSICLDLSGDIVVLGEFRLTADFVGNTLTSNGDTDIFIARLSNSTGAVTFLKQLGGSGTETPYNIKVNSLGRYVIFGKYTFAFTLGGFPMNSPSSGKSNFFLTTLNPVTNTFVNAGGFGNDSGYEGYLALDSEDNIYISGVTSDSLKTSNSSYNIPTLNHALTEDEAVFILKYDPDLTPIRLSYFQGDKLTAALLYIDSNDKLYAAFRTNNYILIGDGSFYDSNTSKIVLAELDSHQGRLIWSDQIYGQANALDLNMDKGGYLWTTGIFGADLRAGNTRIKAFGNYYQNDNQIDAFIIKVVK